jgi:translation initiation factor IF-1
VAQKRPVKRKSPAVKREPREERVVEEKSDVIRAEGVVLDARPNTTFKVKLDAGPEVLAHVGGKLRRNYIRILPGDRVVLEISTYDKEKGRIVYRK